MKDIALVCCYNNTEMYSNILKKTLANQKNIDYELIGIDNSDNMFPSAASALNYGIGKSDSEYIIVVHQDFEFINEDALASFLQYSKQFNDNDILGVAGAILDDSAKILKRFIGRNRIIYSSLIDSTNRVKGFKKVESLDECCFGFKRSFWEKHPFDEIACDKWDLYAVDMCLEADRNNGGVYVIPIDSLHHSGGNITKNFYKSLNNLMKKYEKDKKKIITTCVVSDTRHPDFECLKLNLINEVQMRRKR